MCRFGSDTPVVQFELLIYLQIHTATCQNTGKLLHVTIMFKKSKRFKRYLRKIALNYRNSFQKLLYITIVFRKKWSGNFIV